MTVKTQRKSRTPSSTTVATSRRPRTDACAPSGATRGVRRRGADGHGDCAVGERAARHTVEQRPGGAFHWADPSRRHTLSPPCAAAHARDESRWPRPDVRRARESAGAGGGCASCGLTSEREAGRANGSFPSGPTRSGSRCWRSSRTGAIGLPDVSGRSVAASS